MGAFLAAQLKERSWCCCCGAKTGSSSQDGAEPERACQQVLDKDSSNGETGPGSTTYFDVDVDNRGNHEAAYGSLNV